MENRRGFIKKSVAGAVGLTMGGALPDICGSVSVSGKSAVSGGTAVEGEMATGWKAGVARVKITPQERIWLAGYGSRNHAAEGVLLDLWAKALVLEDEAGNRSVLVTADLLEFPKQMSDRIRKQLNDQLGFDKAQIILNASHTHTGPVLSSSVLIVYFPPFSAQEQAKLDRYERTLEKQIIDLVVEASQNLEPVTLAAANGFARIQVNRRNNAERQLTPLTELKGPNDYAVPVLKVTNASGQIKAVAFGYACHPTVLDIYLWSGDYPGFAQAELEKWHPGATALFFQGAGADMNPLPRRSIALAKQYGITLAAAVDRTLQEEMKTLPATMKTAYKEVTLPLDTPYSEAYLTNMVQSANESEFNKRCAQRFLDQIKKGQPLMRSYPYPVQAWNIGGWPLFALGGELCIGYAIQLKQKYGEDTFVLGFTNDVMGYIPTLAVLNEGGYEGATSQLEYGLPGLWAPEIESLIYEGIGDLAKQTGIFMQGQPYPSLNNQKIDGYKGIWFTLGQFSEYGDKYSGGLGTYTSNHTPMAIYAPEVQKTFFVYGGTVENRKSNTYPPREGKSYGDYLLCMAGCFDHKTGTVSKPTVVLDKNGIHDPHDNPTITIDGDGIIWVFPAGRSRSRHGFIFKSRQPYSIDAFDQILEDEICYPHPYYVDGKGFLLLFTKYLGVRLLYFNTSPDGHTWTEHQQLVAIKRPEDRDGGHYQVSRQLGDKIVFFCNWHPNGNVDIRTNIYYLQTVDFGKTWTRVDGTPVSIPVTEVDSETLVREFFSKGQNVYLHDVAFDENGYPILLYLYGNRHEPGPVNGLKIWAVTFWDGKEWINREITTSDHNYDVGSIWATANKWTVIGPTENSPQPWGGGGEIVIWESTDKGKTWKRTKQITGNSPRNHNYVRSVVNGADPFLYFWADGNPDQPSISLMYFGDSEGNVWQLPYTMTKDRQKPQKGLSNN